MNDHRMNDRRLNDKSFACCAVCGQILDAPATSYLLMDQPNPHRIAILRWSRTLAARHEARAACSPEHALEIVAHWMVTGRLDLSFTQAGPQSKQNKCFTEAAPAPRLRGSYRPIGELVINRESVRKLVASDPEALASVLDSLMEALLRDRGLPREKKPASGIATFRRTSIA